MNQILDAIERAQSIIIVGHVRPDGDCLGSAFALREYCLNVGKIVDVGFPSPIPEAYGFIHGIECGNQITRKRYDLFIAVDCGAKDRIGRFDGFFNSATETVWIDHHIGHDGFGQYNLIKADASSTCEIIYELLEDTHRITKEIANYLFIGLSTDTGHFMHNNTTPNVLYVAYKLALLGADTHGLATELYRSRSLAKTKLISRALQTMRFYLDKTVCLIVMNTELLSEVGVDANDTEGIIDYAVAVKGVEIGVSICEEKPKEFKVSFRSRGKHVDEIASVFGGGGHFCASGCRIFGEEESVIEKLINAIKDAQ